jgi:hypothetical protein
VFALVKDELREEKAEPCRARDKMPIIINILKTERNSFMVGVVKKGEIMVLSEPGNQSKSGFKGRQRKTTKWTVVQALL